MDMTKEATVRRSVRKASLTTLAVGALLLSASCGSAPETPGAGPTISATVTRTGTATATSATTSPANGATPSPKPITGANAPAPTRSIPSSLLGHVVSRIPTSRKVVALTFDAQTNSDGVDSILATLAREKVAATFYLTGDFVNRFPTLAVRMSAAGRLGNHTKDHSNLRKLTPAEVRSQVTSAGTTILRVTGEDPHPLFRFPFGSSDSSDLRLVNDLGYVAVGWTVDSLGWQGTSGGQSADLVVRRVLAAATPGQIVLMEVGASLDDSTLDADALPRVISGLRAAGYGFVTLDGLGAR